MSRLQKPKVVILGAGFAGVAAVRKLVSSDVDILLVDRHNYHTFIPMLYQVVTTLVHPHHIIYPIRRLFRNFPQVRFLQGNVKEVDFHRQFVSIEGITISYDYLIIATGSQSQYLGVPGAPEYTLPMRTLSEAIALRDRLLNRFEEAVKTIDPNERQRLLNFIVVGGGATGVELAGALSEFVDVVCKKDYPSISKKEIQITLIHSGEHLFSSYPPPLGKYTAKWLRRRGIKLYLNTKVAQVTSRDICLDNGTLLSSGSVIWTAGVLAATPEATPEVKTASKNKVVVEPTLQMVGYSNVYAVGDVSHVESQEQFFNGVAQEAIQQGKTTANNILRQLKGKSPEPFKYFNKGRLAIIGKHAGIGKIGNFALRGFLPWIMWLGVHLFYLPGIRNRLTVLLYWFRYYFFGDGVNRLILTSIINQERFSKNKKRKRSEEDTHEILF
ncbi:MAG: NAD(P)/FAD-dependent oxidoreductase [Cyanobacteria bacterium P01_A01_bin.84]